MKANTIERRAAARRRLRHASAAGSDRGPRRGVLLLVVLSLLMLMAVMCVTFILVGSQTRRIIREEVRAEQKAVDYRKELDAAAMQLFRGAKETNRVSAIGDHDLLGDMYGNDSVAHQITSIDVVKDGPNNQTVNEFRDLLVATPTNQPDVVPFTAGFFNGRVLTITTGRLRGQSTRIVGSSWEIEPDPRKPQRHSWRFRVVAFPGASGWPEANDRFLINGQAFNGTGFGYRINGPVHWGKDIKWNDWPLALLPFSRPLGLPRMQGGADEDYDAADPQNMHLSYIEYEAGKPTRLLPSFHRPDLIQYARKKAGAPATARDWALADINGGRVPTLKLINARPLPVDHPKFTGGNPAFGASLDMLGRYQFGSGEFPQFDVDNDGDGISESIWIDLGFPAQTTPDGRKFKPLFAFYCADLDGRLNVNAHGNVLQARRSDPPYPSPPPAMKDDVRDWLPASTAFKTNYPAGTYPTNQPPFLGHGYGVAEINLLAMFQHPILGGSLANGQLMYQRFFRGFNLWNDPRMGRVSFDGRYGDLAGSTLDADPLPFPGNTNNWTANGPVTRGDYWSYWIKHFEIPEMYYPTPTVSYTAPKYRDQLSSLSPTDIWGRGMTFVDVGGNPVFLPLPEQWHTHAANGVDRLANRVLERRANPYVLDLSRTSVREGSAPSNPATGPFDRPFTPAELETLLRPFDADAPMLAKRLRMLLLQTASPSPDAVELLRRLVTTDSFDVAAIPTVPAPKTENDLAPFLYDRVHDRNVPIVTRGLGMADLLVAKMKKRSSLTDDQINAQLPLLLPPEVIAGQKFDLNRPFGNGKDDNDNWVVDEPGENEPSRVEAQAVLGSGTLALTGGVDVVADGTIDANDNAGVRYLYAKYLYVMAMTLADDEYDKLTQDRGIADKKGFLARRLAQWAVNVVDYRDPDAIMSAFEYDPNPFDGWDVDGQLSTVEAPPNTGKREVVWGCEAPDLVIAETLAFHDLRLDDTANDAATAKKTTDPTSPDDDLDQVRIPQGSTFFELYCVRSANGTAALPPELYDSETGGLDLARMDNGGVGDNPVWRMVVSAGQLNKDLFSPDFWAPDQFPDSITPQPAPNRFHEPAGPNDLPQSMEIERIVWFTQRPPKAPWDAFTFYNHNTDFDSTAKKTILPRGGYAVVGPRPTTYIGCQRGAGSTAFSNPAKRYLTIPVGYGDLAATTTTGQNKIDSLINPNRRIKPALGIVCASYPLKNRPAAPWAGRAPQKEWGAGLNISEPLFSGDYYPEPNVRNPAWNIDDALGEYIGRAKQFIDKPEDLRTRTLGPAPIPNLGLQVGERSPLKRFIGPKGEPSPLPLQNFRTAFLQRLANPLLPFHPEWNPYITVDSLAIDLTVFNGEKDIAATIPTYINPPDIRARERGRRLAGGGQPDINFLSPRSRPADNDVPADGAGNDVFRSPMGQTLGYLNRGYGTPYAAIAAGQSAELVGIPSEVVAGNLQASPWFNWADRPLVSALELLMVPACSAPRRGVDAYLDQLTNNNSSTLDFVNTASLKDGAYYKGSAGYQPVFHQYLNFFSADKDRGGNAPQFYRLLDFVHVPSRFVGTEKYLNPVSLANGVRGEQPLVAYLRPPFNKVSEYREPGRVNINTISNPYVWQAVVNSLDPDVVNKTGNWMPNWDEMRKSRRGDGAIPGVQRSSGGDGPAFFANPFRSGSGGAFGLPGAVDLGLFASIDATFLRRHTDQHPFFAPLVKGAPTPPAAAYNEPKRHPYFFFQNFQKISNLLTTRSNVYAVWVTVGYFEVAPAADTRNLPLEYQKLLASGKLTNAVLSAIYPDGYVLGQELNADTGEINRHRAFYIFDRTIPVGYEPGEDHNVENAILLKRLIE